MDIGLYIKNRLCDIDSPESLGIRLKRQFIDPADPSVKDAQKSYEITLPATPANNEVFGYVNVEEAQGKFRVYEDARLYADGILIMDGKFRLSEVTKNSYKGNLGVPAPVSVKDVFGDMTLNNAGSWKIDDFLGFESVSQYNNMDKPPVIFPLVLYGLLPKSAKGNGTFTAKDLYDGYVTLGLDRFMPSVNCMETLKKVFANSGYNLSGTALSDGRLSNLYMSYKNPNGYEFDWGVSAMRLTGQWAHYKSGGLEVKYGTNPDRKQYACNIFDSRNNIPRIAGDIGGNISIKGDKTAITVPRGGLYKIGLRCAIQMTDDNYTPIRRMGVESGTLGDNAVEVHLVRNLDKSLSEIGFNNKFSSDNIGQEIGDPDAVFPQPGKVNFIDPKVDKNFLCGFSFGRNQDENYRNPLNTSHCNPMAITGGRSWDFDGGNGVGDRTYSAVDSPGYSDKNGNPAANFTVDLQNSYTGITSAGDTRASGDVNQVVWLNKGDRIDLLTTTNFKRAGFPVNTRIYSYRINYFLDITPFNHHLEWLKVDVDGNSAEAMDWNDAGTFVENQIDLIKALPSEIKVNDWIDNFCKAFNLVLYNTGKKSFNLDVKGKGSFGDTSVIIDLDGKADVNHSVNRPLSLPDAYELGFTADTGEEGYFRSIKEFDGQGEPVLSLGDNGGGTFDTGNRDGNKITRTSNFSYCWYKDISYAADSSTLSLPVITDKEIWENDYDYKEMSQKLYFDKGQRFWYKSGVKELDLGLGRTATVALVSNEYNGARGQALNYRNKPGSIMRNYFLLLTNKYHYTVVECYLTPYEYSKLDVASVKFNGDLYNVAEIDGYDPLGNAKGTIKLIRRIL